MKKAVALNQFAGLVLGISLARRILAPYDERDLQIARAEFQLVEAFKVGGGALAAIKPGSRFVYRRFDANPEEKLRSQVADR